MGRDETSWVVDREAVISLYSCSCIFSGVVFFYVNINAIKIGSLKQILPV